MSEATGRQISGERANVKKSIRQRPLPPDVVARNLAIEKQRREAMNENFRVGFVLKPCMFSIMPVLKDPIAQDLARLVPAINSPRRCSKVSIVKETIRHIQQQREMCIAAANDLQNLLAENNRLVLEINAFRSQVGGATLKPMLVTEAMAQLIDVKDSACNNSPREFSEYWIHDSPESGIDSGSGPLVSDRTTEPQAMDQYSTTVNLQHPQVSVQNYPLTTEGGLHGAGLASAPDVHNLWAGAESEFEFSQTSYTELPMPMHDPILEGYPDNVGRNWFAGETTAICEDHTMKYPDYHLNPISSTPRSTWLSGYAT